jgi:hypothetical protein
MVGFKVHIQRGGYVLHDLWLYRSDLFRVYRGYPKLVAILCSIGLLVVGLTLVYINENEPGLFSLTMTVIGYLLCALFAISFVLNLGHLLLLKRL